MRYIIEDDWLVVDPSNMSLTTEEIDLIKLSWLPVLDDPTGSGVLLFKELFTKFPEYLKLFQKFKDLNVNELEKNKRLVAHASKVIDTITAVVNLLGDKDKSEILSDALQATASSHIGRHIGVDKFKNLGIVLIDFMCQINQRYQGEMKQLHQRIERQLGKPSESDLSGGCTRGANMRDSLGEEGYLTLDSDNDNDSSQERNSSHQSNGDDSDLMSELHHKMNSTSLDDEDDGVDVCPGQRTANNTNNNNSPHNWSRESSRIIANNGKNSSSCNRRLPAYIKHNVEPKRLVAVWTKLYSCILEAVQAESDRYDKLPKGNSKDDEDMSRASSQYNPSSLSSLEDDSIQPL